MCQRHAPMHTLDLGMYVSCYGYHRIPFRVEYINPLEPNTLCLHEKQNSIILIVKKYIFHHLAVCTLTWDTSIEVGDGWMLNVHIPQDTIVVRG